MPDELPDERTPARRRSVTCDLCGVVVDDAMGHVVWHLYLTNLGRILGVTGEGSGLRPVWHVT